MSNENILTVENFITRYCHERAIKKAKKELKAVWNDNVLSPGPDFEVCEFLGLDLLEGELERLVEEMEIEEEEDYEGFDEEE